MVGGGGMAEQSFQMTEMLLAQLQEEKRKVNEKREATLKVKIPAALGEQLYFGNNRAPRRPQASVLLLNVLISAVLLALLGF